MAEALARAWVCARVASILKTVVLSSCLQRENRLCVAIMGQGPGLSCAGNCATLPARALPGAECAIEAMARGSKKCVNQASWRGGWPLPLRACVPTADTTSALAWWRRLPRA